MKFLNQGIYPGPNQSESTRPVYTTIAVAFIAVFLFSAFHSLPTAHAATLSIDPSKGAYGPGDTFVITVRLDPGVDECINATTVELIYPKGLMNASAVSKGESVLTLWPSEPVVDHERGLVSFSGGIPAGYCGRILGDPGKTNIIAKVIFNIPGEASGDTALSRPLPMPITFGAGTMVLENDGFGTPVPLILEVGTFTRTVASSGAPNEWLEIVHADVIKPDIFAPMLHQDEKMFQGKHFLIFSAIDKQSGVHHYEVSEDDPQSLGMVRGTPREIALFVNAVSPYVLRDQELGSRIIVRAIDHAGNVQETILAPTNVEIKKTGNELLDVSTWSTWWYVLVFGVIVILGGAFLLQRYLTRPQPTDPT